MDGLCLLDTLERENVSCWRETLRRMTCVLQKNHSLNDRTKTTLCIRMHTCRISQRPTVHRVQTVLSDRAGLELVRFWRQPLTTIERRIINRRDRLMIISPKTYPIFPVIAESETL